MIVGRIQYFWLEILAGLYMILAAMGVRLEGGTAFGAIVLPTAYLFAAGTLHLSRLLASKPRLRAIFMLYPAVTLVATGAWHVRFGRLEAGLFEWAIALTFFAVATHGLRARTADLRAPARMLPVASGIFFMAFAAAALFGRARLLGAWSGGPDLAVAGAAALIGGVLLAGELARRDWLAFAPFAGAAGFAAIGYGYWRAGDAPFAAAFFMSALFLSLASSRRARFDPDDLSGLDERQREIYAFERLGEGVFWATVMLSAVYLHFTEAVDLKLYFAGLLLGALVTQVSYRFVSPARLHERRYLLTLLGVVGAFLVMLQATGGIESPFFVFCYLAIFASTVVISWQWPVLLSVVFAAYTALDAVLGAHGARTDALHIARHAFFALTLLLTGLYASWISRRREADRAQVVASRTELERALREANEGRRQTEARSEELRTLNADLLQMRSALMNVLEDVEDSKREIEIDRRQLSAILAAVGDGIVAADRDGRIYLCNPACARLLGRAAEDVIGKEFDAVVRFVAEDGDVLQTEAIAKAFRGEGGRLPDRLAMLAADGGRLSVSGTIAPIRDEQDRLNGVVLAVRDVTAEREIDRQKSNFIAIASHQLRTPLSAIRWFLDLLLAGDVGALKPAQRDFLSDVHASTVRMSRLVDDLLSVSRIESGKLRVVLRATPAAAFVSGVLKEHRPLIESKRIVFTEDVPKDLPDIDIDPTLSAQALGNVLSNAIKYTSEGGKIAVRARSAGGAVEVEVADTGLGIPAGQHHRIYEKFWRGENVLLKETVGTGLGLYLAKTVLDLTGGTIRFESEEGKGSRFFVAFPKARAASPGGGATAA